MKGLRLSGVVMLDFLIRHGIITAENKKNLCQDNDKDAPKATSPSISIVNLIDWSPKVQLYDRAVS